MPLLHQDISRSPGGIGGGAGDGRSLAEFLGLETTHLADTPTMAPKLMTGVGERDWLWSEPSSPEAAQTPRALVPANCFPPRHPRNFASYSENARPGNGWNDEPAPPSQGITDLVSSLKSLAMPGARKPQSYSQTSIRVHLSYEGLEKNDAQWPAEQMNNVNNNINNKENNISPRDEKFLSRRASFCGGVSARKWGETPRWTGSLPPRCQDPNSGISSKLFLGGLPWDINEQALFHTFRHFQPVSVEWPERESGMSSPRGFAYVLFESEWRVRALLAASRREGNDWYFHVHSSSRKIRSKKVQVIPWSVRDASWVGCGSARLEPARTVFVGALHGMLSAAALARIMDDLFSGVVYAGIDTDKNKYPIGSGRVTFNNVRSYVRAISAGFAVIETDKFTKKVQLLPYLEDSMCSVCNLQQGPYFCREPTCYRYFCRSCWQWQHPHDEHESEKLTRNCKSNAPQLVTQARHSGSEHSAYNGYNGTMEGTPSPPMSGSEYSPPGTSGGEYSPPGAGGGDSPSPWQ